MADRDRDSESMRFATMALSMVAMIIIALMVLCYRSCQNNDDRKAKCIEETHDIVKCDCAFSNVRCDLDQGK